MRASQKPLNSLLRPLVSTVLFLAVFPGIQPLLSAGEDPEPVTRLPLSTVPAQENRVITLDEAYGMVLATDETIRIALLEIRRARLLPWGAITRVTPRFTGSLDYGNTEGANDRSEDKGLGFRISQTLLDFTVFPAYRVAALTSRIRALEKDFTAREALFGVAQAYYAVLTQNRLIELNRETLQLAEKQLEQATQRHEIGEAARIDMLRARLDVENTRRSLINAEANAVLARNTLLNILNLHPESRISLEEPERLGMPELSYEHALQTAYLQREDFQASALSIDQEKFRKNLALAGYLPTVSGTLSQDWSDPKSSTRGKDSWAAGISIDLPFFEGGQRELDIQDSKYAQRQAVLSHQRLIETIQGEVKEAWVRLHALHKTLAALSIAVEASQQSYEDIQARYEVGEATSLDSLIALRDLNGARTDFAVAQYDYAIALRELRRSIGELGNDRISR
jgi:outer membrane protein TolC